MLLQYANRQGWIVHDIYSDDDYTGADRHRPQFCRLLADAQAKKFDIVLCKTQSRFTRELELVETYIHGLFPLWGIRFVSIVDNADTANKGNKKSRQINGLVNEWYLEDMSDNIRSVLTNRRQNGLFIGAFAPYGYQKDPGQKGHLIPEPEAAEIVQEIFTLFAKGYGKTAIARRLNDRGIPNPTEYKRLHGLHYQNSAACNSTLWKYHTISDILNNEVYIGNMVQGKSGSISYKSKVCRPVPRSEWIIVRGTHDAIICPELWERTRRLISQKAKPYITGEVGLFSGKARCCCCGYLMRSSKNRGRHYLQCQTRYVSKGTCTGAFIPVSELEQIVIQELKILNGRYLDIPALEQGIRNSCDNHLRRERITAEIFQYRKKAAECLNAMKALYVDRAKGIITEEDFRDLSAAFSGEKERWEKWMHIAQKNLAAADQSRDAEKERKALIDRYLKMDHLNREMVDVLISQIRVGRRERGTQLVPVEIHWNF